MKGKVLVLSGSPRRHGNSEDLALVAAEAIRADGGVAECISLASLKIAPCSACDLCAERKAKYCAVRDSMDELYGKVLDADAMLLVSPVYWFTYSAQLKVFVDRLYGLWNWNHDFLRGKPVASVLVYGDRDVYASGGVNALDSFSHMFAFLGAVNKGAAYGTTGEQGDALKDTALVERVRSLARELL